jgi:GNAT superfamily N-acetyltransferase
MNIRKALQQDIPIIVALRLQMLHEVAEDVPEHLEIQICHYLKQHLANDTCVCLLCEDQGRVIAKAMLCLYDVMPDEVEVNTTGKTATLSSVYTLPEYRGRGLMKNLLGSLFEVAREMGVKIIFAAAETKAIPLYGQLGFCLMDNEMRLLL